MVKGHVVVAAAVAPLLALSFAVATANGEDDPSSPTGDPVELPVEYAPIDADPDRGVDRPGGRGSRAERPGSEKFATTTAMTYRIRGTVACPSGMPVVGAWMQSSGGGSQFLDWSPYPGTSGIIAHISATFTTSLTTYIYLNVGCGGTRASWGSSNRTPTVKVSSGSLLFLNTECNGQGSCGYFRMENNTPLAPISNVFASTQCTWRAAEYWKRMTGRYPNWRDRIGRYGDAYQWDDNAAYTGWTVRSWPRPDSIAVWQQNMGGVGSLGHVGYVYDTRVYNGALQMLIYDRNSDGHGGDRSGVWVYFTSGMKFLVVPPRRA